MENLVSVIQWLFRDFPVGDIFLGELHSYGEFRFYDIDQNYLVKQSLPYSKRYSETEMRNLWKFYSFEWLQKLEHQLSFDYDHNRINPFELLKLLSDSCLVFENNCAVVDFNKFLAWRKLTSSISEDLCVCIFYASRFEEKEMCQIGFDWPYVIGQNHYALNEILNMGISENHFHLYASSPTFHFSWISLMNRIGIDTSVEKQLHTFEKNKQYQHIDPGYKNKKLSLSQMRRMAAYIRLMLFSYVSKEHVWIDDNRSLSESYNNKAKDEDGWYADMVEHVFSILQHDEAMYEYQHQLRSSIEIIFGEYDPKRTQLDYISAWYKANRGGGKVDLYTGERWLLYMCMKSFVCDENKIDSLSVKMGNLFYAYCIIRENIRSELIQANGRNGFSNFQTYERRKYDLIDDAKIKQEMTKRGLQEVWRQGNIKALEIRFTPYDTWQDNKEIVRLLDNLLDYKNHPNLFYVMHFLKRSDSEKPYLMSYVPRNYDVRQKVYKQAKAIMNLRRHAPEEGMRILGIDAASMEIGCRPEVFGPVFRMLKNDIRIINGITENITLPQLKATFHVGEEFLDPLDGLRAIDEAINFLNLENGDRIGHVMALGIDVREWYAKKGYIIRMPMQDALDNTVWLYYQLDRFHIDKCESLKSRLHDLADLYFHKVYGRFIYHQTMDYILKKADEYNEKAGKKNRYYGQELDFDMAKYFRAWMIRGDEPSLYRNGYFQWTDTVFNVNPYDCNTRFPSSEKIREIPEVFLLNFLYHYDENVKKAGMQPIDFEVTNEYIEAIIEVQKRLISKIENEGIHVEANPSSNYEIGIFKNYGKHPMLNLYNKGLKQVEEGRHDSQLSVSINTDDMGTFSTTLPNEYALVAAGLASMVDEKGRRLFGMEEILNWIKDIRDFGNDQSFYRQSSNDSTEKDNVKLHETIKRIREEYKKENTNDFELLMKLLLDENTVYHEF